MPSAEPRPDVAEQLDRGRLALQGGRGHVRAGDLVRVAAQHLQQPVRHRRVGPGQLAGLADQRVARGVLLPAAAVAALAPVPAGHADHVAPLPGHAVRAAEQLTVDHQRRRRYRCPG